MGGGVRHGIGHLVLCSRISGTVCPKPKTLISDSLGQLDAGCQQHLGIEWHEALFLLKYLLWWIQASLEPKSLSRETLGPKPFPSTPW